MSNKLVKDYLGNLVPKDKAHKIHDKYYVEGESCFLMEDNQWYRVTSTDKILFDNYKGKYVLLANSKAMIKGIINEKGEEGYFSENEDVVRLKFKSTQKETNILNENVAESLGYIESISDGMFYDKSTLSNSDLTTWFNKKNIPANERSKSYNLESDPERKKQLEEAYGKLEIKISPMAKRLSRFLGDYSIGMEAEVINGFIPRRIRNKFGLKALKDGSLRNDNGEGIEYVSMPMKGAKGIEVVRQFCKELTRRCEVNNYCSVHFHFGNVPKDKLYTLSIYRLGMLLQDELRQYFPYSRFNTIKGDGKVYCKFLQDLDLNTTNILSQKTEEDFSKAVVNEFNKIYKWLNNGKGLAEVRGEPQIERVTVEREGKKMFYDKWLKNVYSTKSVHHSVQGEKWNKEQRYHYINFLNLYFSRIGTIEFRCHEGSTNSTKALIWLVTCASILRYAENIKKCLSSKKITLREVLLENLGEKYTDYVMAYYDHRKKTFFKADNTYREYKSTEKVWFGNDPEFSFKVDDIEIK